jgi:hypothetical protein
MKEELNPNGPATPAEHTAQEWESYYLAARQALAELGKLSNAFAHEIETAGAYKLDSPNTAAFVVAELAGSIQEAHLALRKLEAWFTWLGASDAGWLKDALESFGLPAASAETIARWASEQNKRGMLAEKRGRKAN